MSAVKYFLMNLGDYLVDAENFTWLQDCAYWRLMRACYGSEKPLPLVRARIYRMVHADSKSQKSAVDFILNNYFDRHQDGFHQHRIDLEIARFHHKSKVLSENAQARWEHASVTDSSRIRREFVAKTSDIEGGVGRVESEVIPEVESRVEHEPPGTQQTPNGLGNGHANADPFADASADASADAFADADAYRTNIKNHKALATLAPRAHTSIAPLISKRLRALGINANPSHPVLLQAIAEGGTELDFQIAGAQALASVPSKGFGWVCAAVLGRLRDATRNRQRSDAIFKPEAGVGRDEPPRGPP